MDMNSFYSISKEKAKLAAAEEEFKQINKLLNREREHRSALRELLNDTEQRIEKLNKDLQKANAKIERLRNKAEQEELARKLQEQKNLEEKAATDTKQDAISEVIPAPWQKLSFIKDILAIKEHGTSNGVNGTEPARIANLPSLQPQKEIIVPISENPDLEASEKLWNGAVQAIRNERKMSMYSCAKGGRVFGMVDDTLVVIFKSAFQSNRMNKQDFRQVMEDLLYKASDRRLKLQCYGEAEYKKLLDSQNSEPKTVDIEEYYLF